jgi:hypothetical protein
MHGRSAIRIGGWILLGVAGAAVLGLVLGLVIMWLWNWLMPGIFGLPAITYWQAVGIFILCHLLFKNHPGHGHRPRVRKDRYAYGSGSPHGYFRDRMRSHFHETFSGEEAAGTTGEEETPQG